MKALLVLFTVLFSQIAFPGQHGSGGNVCKAKGEDVYRPFDQIKFPHLVKNNDYNRGSHLLVGKKQPTYYIPIYDGQLINGRSSVIAKEKIEGISKFNNQLSQILLIYYDLLKDVYVIPHEFSHYAEVGDGSSELCEEGTLKAVFINRPTGALYVSQKLWESLDVTGQEILILHEVLRIAQQFSPWLNVSNDDLELLTMLLHSQRYEDFLEHDFSFSFQTYYTEKKIDVTDGPAMFEKHRQVILNKNSSIETYLNAGLAREFYKKQFEAFHSSFFMDEIYKYKFFLRNEFVYYRNFRKDSRYFNSTLLDLEEEFGKNGP